MNHTQFDVSRFENRNGSISWRVTGWLHGLRVRKNFKSREEAAAEKATLEIKALQATSGLRSIATPPLACAIHETVFSKRAPRRDSSALPDSVPVKKGVVLLESGDCADYHPFASLQLAGITKRNRFVVVMASVCYQLSLAPTADLDRIFREFIAEGLVSSQCGHFTAFEAGDFLDWLPSRRYHCSGITEIAEIPDTLGGFKKLADFRSDPGHAAFRSRVPPSGSRPGIDL